MQCIVASALLDAAKCPSPPGSISIIFVAICCSVYTPLLPDFQLKNFNVILCRQATEARPGTKLRSCTETKLRTTRILYAASVINAKYFRHFTWCGDVRVSVKVSDGRHLKENLCNPALINTREYMQDCIDPGKQGSYHNPCMVYQHVYMWKFVMSS